MNKKNNRVYIDDIIDSINRINEYTASVAEHKFLEDHKIQDAVLHRFEIIGEAAKHVSEDFKEKHSEVPWSKIMAFRNVLTHEYQGVKMDRVWKILNKEFRELETMIKNLTI